MRKLASIRYIDSILPIDGADMIELAVVDGWQVVVGKADGFKAGSLGVFFEIDSFLDTTKEEFAFLDGRATNWNNKRGARIKTIKLRGQLSQGLLMPISKFPVIVDNLSHYLEDVAYIRVAPIDVTELLGVDKWERIESGPGFIAGRSKGNFPTFIFKTDQERAQNLKSIILNTTERFQVTMKLDGSSMTVYSVPRKSVYYDIANKDGADVEAVFGVCSRNLEVKEGGAFYEMATKLELNDKLLGLGEALAIQGELIGPGIQKNYEKVTENEFHVYDIFDIDKQEYLSNDKTKEICDYLGVNHVPILEESIILTDRFTTINDFLEYAEGDGMNPGVKREGVVFKSLDSQFSFKVISNAYLIKTGN